MKASNVILLVVAMTSTGTIADELSPDSWRDAYSKRNVRLGITLEEFRKTPFPDPNEKYHHVVPTPKCSDEQISNGPYSIGFLFDLTDYEKVGAIKCGYYGTYTYMVNPYMKEQSLEQISPLLVDWAPDANYYFYKPDGSESFYLFHITTGENWPYHPIANAFEDALGKPTSRDSVRLQNAFGATVTSTTSIWDNGISRIRLVSNNGSIDRHTLDYELTPILEMVKAKLEDTKKESRNRL